MEIDVIKFFTCFIEKIGFRLQNISYEKYGQNYGTLNDYDISVYEYVYGNYHLYIRINTKNTEYWYELKEISDLYGGTVFYTGVINYTIDRKVIRKMDGFYFSFNNLFPHETRKIKLSNLLKQ